MEQKTGKARVRIEKKFFTASVGPIRCFQRVKIAKIINDLAKNHQLWYLPPFPASKLKNNGQNRFSDPENPTRFSGFFEKKLTKKFLEQK